MKAQSEERTAAEVASVLASAKSSAELKRSRRFSRVKSRP